MQELQDDIILTFQQGNEQAFEQVFEHFYEPLFIFCKYMVPVEQAEDVVADAFFKLWKLRDRWTSIANVKAFLYVTARNACFDLRRHEKIKVEKLEELSSSLAADQQELIVHAEVETEFIHRIKTEIANLPETSKAVFTLAFLEGYENKEIADRLNVSIQTVRNLKSLAVKSIRNSLIKKGLHMGLTSFMLHFLLERGDF